jgi:hypothetical protein
LGVGYEFFPAHPPGYIAIPDTQAFAHYRTIATILLCHTHHYLTIMTPEASRQLRSWPMLAFYYPANYL